MLLLQAGNGRRSFILLIALGYKFFKEKEDGTFEIIRVIEVREVKKEVGIQFESDGFTKRMPYDWLKSYTPLEPYGLVMFNIVSVYDEPTDSSSDDVMITATRLIDIKLGDYNPFIICRQSINDFFADFLNPMGNSNLCGISVNRDNCPTNIPFGALLTADEIKVSNMVAVYRDDTIESILRCVPQKRYNEVLSKLYMEHCKASVSSNPFATRSDGWCKTLQDLLEDNNFISDFNYMSGATGVAFDLKNYLLPVSDKLPGCYQLDKAALVFFNSVFKVNAVNTRVVKWDYSIDLGEFNNDKYTFLRDSTDTLYMVVYLTKGEYLESELEKQAQELSLSEELRLTYYNKYKNQGGK